MIQEHFENFQELSTWLFWSLVITPLVAIFAAPVHLVWVVSGLFVIDVCVGIQTSEWKTRKTKSGKVVRYKFSVAEFRRVIPKFTDSCLVILITSLLAGSWEYIKPLQLTGYIGVSFWLASSIVDNKINYDEDPNNPWRWVRDLLVHYNPLKNKGE